MIKDKYIVGCIVVALVTIVIGVFVLVGNGISTFRKEPSQNEGPRPSQDKGLKLLSELMPEFRIVTNQGTYKIEFMSYDSETWQETDPVFTNYSDAASIIESTKLTLTIKYEASKALYEALGSIK